MRYAGGVGVGVFAGGVVTGNVTVVVAGGVYVVEVAVCVWCCNRVWFHLFRVLCWCM